MNRYFEAKYFDGKSSASRHITIALVESARVLRLQLEGGDFLDWPQSLIRPHFYTDQLELRNSSLPGALLVIQGSEEAKQLNALLHRSQKTDIHSRLLDLGFSKIIFIAIGLLGLIVLGYFYVLPPVAEKTAAILPESVDDELGNAVENTILEYSEVDWEKTELLEEFAAQFDWQSSRPLQFTVVSSPMINAFALPNGHIVVYTGILQKMESPEELAALLGHEASHVNHRHSIKMLSRNVAGYMIISLLLSDVNGVVTVLVDNAQQLHSLSYSRKFEQEADEQGLKILMDNRVNPFGMVRLFEKLENANQLEIPSILSSHPLTSERKKNMETIISESNYTLNPPQDITSIFNQLKGEKSN